VNSATAASVDRALLTSQSLYLALQEKGKDEPIGHNGEFASLLTGVLTSLNTTNI